MTEIAIPSTGTASVHVLHEGYVGLAGDGERVSGIFSHQHPDHTDQDISTVAVTPDGVYACTHAWWPAAGPEDDPLGTDATALKASRDLLRGLATVVIPGHGGPFRPGEHA